MVVRSVSEEDIKVISVTDLFQPDWYLETYPDVKELGMDPAEHYLVFGVRLKRNPSPYFDTSFYINANSDVARSGINPLIHYIRWGKGEGRQKVPMMLDGEHKEYLDNNKSEIDDLEAAINSHPKKLSDEEIYRILDFQFEYYDEPEISVIIPVYNQISYTARCLQSLAKQKCSYPFEVIIMDDCSSDRDSNPGPHID